jgi:flagellar biosynthetic protein FlhB
MADEKDAQEKTEEPSQYRIDEYRRKGQVASSKELNSVMVLAGSVLTLVLSSVFIYESIQEYCEWLFSLDATAIYNEKELMKLIKKSLVTLLKCAGPVSLMTFFIGMLSQVAQIGFLYAPEVLTLKLERVNPIEGFKRLFSVKSLVETIKGLLKFSVILSISYLVMKDDLLTFTGFLQNDFVLSFAMGKYLMIKLAISVIVGMVLIAIADFAWEKYSYKKKMMMSKQELKEELKEKDGNPEVRQKIRSIQREMATKKMMTDVPEADVIVTNPTHISVALKYDVENMVSPTVVAKGIDHVALKIREIAKQNDVPIVENIPLARTLNKTVDVGEGIPRHLYKTVAEILAFVYKLKRRKKALGSGVTTENEQQTRT